MEKDAGAMRLDLKLARLVGILFSPWQRRRLRRAEITVPETKPLTLITGASGGIGEALAVELATSGHNLLLTGRDEERLAAAVKAARAAATGEVLSIAVDLADEQAAALIDEVLAARGFHVEVLINNAGLAERQGFTGSDIARVKAVLDVNVEVLTRLTHHYLPPMLARGRGAVVNMSSIGGLAPGPYQTVYYASKAYVTSFTEAVAFEARGRGVFITSVLPGPVKTDFHKKANGIGSLYLTLFGEMRPEAVARATHRALLARHWPLVTPGALYMVLGACMRVIPGSLLTPLMGLLYKQRTSRQLKGRGGDKND